MELHILSGKILRAFGLPKSRFRCLHKTGGSTESDSWSRIHQSTTLGCIDWTHVHIKKPVNHVEVYIGRKGVPTINVHAVYDASYRITSFTQVHCQLARAKA
ncbi:hypothetical protein DPMN_081252 [Dreissena polymorpha]|uniref:Uncharacterized protein n=1 Tax=Dreissena polymorpha TaxID=45954 RepID=A0A9D3Y8N9_DREPO|nr:hypothetical protein DPMN_081252 [Dreissena polymorpha]